MNQGLMIFYGFGTILAIIFGIIAFFIAREDYRKERQKDGK
jgi:hypothetical protein